MDFIVPVLAVTAINTLYFLEQSICTGEDLYETRGLGFDDRMQGWADFVMAVILFSLNLAGLWLCLFRLLSRAP